MRFDTKLILGCAAAALVVGSGVAMAQGGPIPDYNKIGPGGAIAPPMPPGGGAVPGYRQQSVIDGVQKKTPEFEDVFNVLDALQEIPATTTVKPKKARKILIYAQAKGYGHSSIPITAFAITELGKHTGAWSADTSYSAADFTAANLAKYDALVLDNTTGAFLDDPADAAGTAARRKALLDFVRGGHGLILTHAAGDTYHGTGLARGATPPPGPPPVQHSLWPEYTKMVGGYFKWHWYYPQPITVKIDDPKSPITAPFGGKEFVVHDEVYTFANDSYSRKNVHVLTSVDYSKMSAEDKAKENADNPSAKRTDGDYALSWIRREGQGRVYYNVLGHSEHIYFLPKMLQSIAAGIQYALGDLAADDSPSVK